MPSRKDRCLAHLKNCNLQSDDVRIRAGGKAKVPPKSHADATIATTVEHTSPQAQAPSGSSAALITHGQNPTTSLQADELLAHISGGASTSTGNAQMSAAPSANLVDCVPRPESSLLWSRLPSPFDIYPADTVNEWAASYQNTPCEVPPEVLAMVSRSAMCESSGMPLAFGSEDWSWAYYGFTDSELAVVSSLNACLGGIT